MKRTNMVFYLLTVTMLFTGCQMHTGDFRTYFWTSSHLLSEYHLYIDDVDRGKLPFLDKAPACGSALLKQKALYLHLPSGSYQLDVRDITGRVQYAEKLRIKRRVGSITISSTTQWQKGGSRGTNEQDCLIREIY